MELINGCHVIVSTKVSETRRVILAVREDGADRGKTYITAAAQVGPVDHWDHGRYFTGEGFPGHRVSQADALGKALEDHAARVANYS